LAVSVWLLAQFKIQSANVGGFVRQMIRKPQKPHLRKGTVTADLRERSADDSETSAISSDSVVLFVANVVIVVRVSSGLRLNGFMAAVAAASMPFEMMLLLQL
jgi:hypothetical protein